MLLADVSFSTESLVVITTLIVALAGTIGVLFRQLIASKDDQLKDMISQCSSFKEMAEEAITNLEKVAREHFVKEQKK